MQLLQYIASPPGGRVQCHSYNAPPHCLGAVGKGTCAKDRLTARGQGAVGLPQCTASLPGGSGQGNSCNTLPHCVGVVGSGTPAGVCGRQTAGGAGGKVRLAVAGKFPIIPKRYSGLVEQLLAG